MSPPAITRWLALSVALVTACSPSSPSATSSGLTTETDSRALPDVQQRLAFLARYLRSKSPISDAEYIIHYRDNSGGSVPGPSDWDIRAVLQVADDGAAWHAGWEPCPAAGNAKADDVPAWTHDLLDRRPPWKAARASPRCFRDPRQPSSTVLVFADDHLVAYATATQ